MIIETKYNVQQTFYQPLCKLVGDGQYEASVAKRVISALYINVDINGEPHTRYQVDGIGQYHEEEFFELFHPFLEQARIVAQKYQDDGVELRPREYL